MQQENTINISNVLEWTNNHNESLFDAPTSNDFSQEKYFEEESTTQEPLNCQMKCQFCMESFQPFRYF